MTQSTMHNGKKEVFEKWNIQKQVVDARKNTKTIKERDIVFLSIGENVGFEQNGKGEKFLRPVLIYKKFLRPVLIYKKFSNHLFLGLPLTSQKRKDDFMQNFRLKKKRVGRF